MIVIEALLALSAASPSAEADAWAQSNAELVGEPPIHMAVQGVSAERTIAEFMQVCFRPKWNVADFQEAVKSSDFAYREEPTKNSSSSFAWKANRAYLVVNVGREFSQCALSIGSIQPRSGGQLLAMLKPAVEAELGQQVQENDGEFYLQWTDAALGDLERISLAGAGTDSKQAIWYVFDKTAPGVREELERLVPRPPSKQPE